MRSLADNAGKVLRVDFEEVAGQRVGDTLHGDLAMQIAMETFTIRFM